jgi:hypothetical protein
MVTLPRLYTTRMRGQVGATVVSALPSLVSELKGGETALTGLHDDPSASFGVLAQIEALRSELLELRQRSKPKRPVGATSNRAPPEDGGRGHIFQLRHIPSSGTARLPRTQSSYTSDPGLPQA